MCRAESLMNSLECDFRCAQAGTGCSQSERQFRAAWFGTDDHKGEAIECLLATLEHATIVQDVVDQIALVIRFISLFTILAGAIILASSVAGTRFRRIREVVILKTLGATRRRVAGIFSVEFLILGAVAGLIGGILASGFSGLLLVRFFEGRLRFDPLPNLLAIALTALIANTAGWLASFRILGRKPLDVLREE